MTRGARPPRPPGRGAAAGEGCAAGGAHEVRIIGGRWKRSKLPVATRAGLRPTPDRVRETLFNWLGQDLSGWRCIDAFAGTGVLGFEAASRGARDVLLVEQDGEQVDRLRATQARLQASGVRVWRGDGLAALRREPPGSVDLVFLDPPFAAERHADALRAAAPLLAAHGRIYLEAPRAWTDDELGALGLCVRRHLKAGAVHAHLLTRTEAAHV